MEDKGWKLNKDTVLWAGIGGRIEVFEYLRGKPIHAGWMEACKGAARGGHLKALKYLRGLDPPCPWDEGTCAREAWGGTCSWAAQKGHLEVLKFARGQDPPCPWSRSECREEASQNGHQHFVDWIDQQEDESDLEYWGYSDNDSDMYW